MVLRLRIWHQMVLFLVLIKEVLAGLTETEALVFDISTFEIDWFFEQDVIVSSS